MSKFIFDSMVPKYPEFLSSISSHLSPSTNSSPATSAIASQLRAVAAAAAASSTSTSPPSTSSLLNYNNNTNSSSGGAADLNSLSDSPHHHHHHQQPSSTTHNNKIGGGEENHSPLTTSSAEGSPNSPIFPTNKMYPYVSAHPAGHAGLTGMSFTGLEDKSCRWVYVTFKLSICFSILIFCFPSAILVFMKISYHLLFFLFYCWKFPFEESLQM